MKITKDQLKGGSVVMDASQFHEAAGELHAGKNILKLQPGQAAGPFVLVEILADQELGTKGRKKLAPVDVYIGEDAAGTRWNMPLAAAFISKVEEAKLAIGDTFLVLRTDDYTSNTYGTKGQGYSLKVTARAKKKA
jgi:hypothetical protein